MSIIYEPKGAAREYSELAANLYSGCEHGCTYCYAPSATYKTREVFSQAKARDGVVSKIEKEAHKYSGREILLCFTCDPYQAIDADLKLTRETIKIFGANGIHTNILTKAGLASTRDFDLLSQNGSRYGASLTFLDNSASEKTEPLAASPDERLEALREAKRAGIKTWISLEPVLDPAQSLEIIDRTKGFVDTYKVGKWNHDKKAKEIDWKRFALSAMDKLEKTGAEYYIKKELAKYL